MTEQIKDSAESAGLAIQALIPKSLDDIIRINREFAQLRLTTEDEILELYKEITPDYPKDIVDDWNLISLHKPGATLVFLLGDVRQNGRPRMTSDVTGIDIDRRYLKTKSGSLYQLGSQSKDPPSQDELYLICATFHSWGFGNALGVPHFFY